MSIESRALPVVTPEDEELDLLVVLRDTDLDSLDDERYTEFYDADWSRLSSDIEVAERLKRETPLDLSYPRDSKRLDTAIDNYNSLMEWRNSLIDVDENNGIHALLAGIDVLAINEHNSFQQVAKRNGVDDITQRSIDLLSFQRKGYVFVRYGGLSLYEFATTNIDDIPLPQGIQFLVDAFHGTPDGTFGAPESINVPKDYPVLLKSAIRKVPDVVGELIYTDANEMYTNFGMERGIRGKAVSRSVQLLDKVREIRKRVDSVLVNPNSPDFDAVKCMFEGCFNNPECDELVLTFLMTNEQDRDYITFYRRIQQLQKDGLHPDFYRESARRLEASNRIYLDEENLVTPDEFKRATSGTSFEEEEVVGIEQVSVAATVLASKSSANEFNLNGELLDSMDTTLSPSHIQVNLDRRDRKKSTVRFTLDQFGGKTLEIMFDGKNNTIDWHMMPEMEKEDRDLLTKSLLDTYESLIRHIDDVREQKRLEAQAQALARQQTQTPRFKRTKPETVERVIAEKEVVELSKAEEVIITDHSISSPANEAKVKQTIIPDDAVFNKAKEGMIPDHFNQVLDKIEQFNNGLTGAFKKLSGASDGMYRLFCGKYRVIVEEVGGQNGEQTFVVRSIEPRNNEYREYKKGRLKSKKRK